MTESCKLNIRVNWQIEIPLICSFTIVSYLKNSNLPIKQYNLLFDKMNLPVWINNLKAAISTNYLIFAKCTNKH